MNNLTCLYENDGYVNSFAKLMAQVRGHATDSFTANEWLMSERNDDSATPEAESTTESLSDGVDSREKLEADIQSESFSFFHTPYGLRKMRGWLDRQAAMTERYWRGQVDALAAKGDQLAEANAELRDAVEELKVERDEAVEAYDAHMAAHDAWHEAEDITYTRNRFAVYEQATKERVARLESERDALQAKLDALEAHGVTISEPFCGGYEVYDQFACDWRRKADMLEAEARKLEAERDELTAANDKWLAKLGELQAELADCEREREKYRARLGEAARLCLQAAALADGGR